MPPIVPFLWFADNNAKEAVDYYCSVFPQSHIESIEYYPDEQLDEHFVGMKGKVLTAEFVLNGQRLMAIDGGPYFRFNEAFSLLVECKDQEEIDYYWEKLSHVKESEQCGWCKDWFGLSWQIVPRDMNALMTSDKAIQTMMAMKKIVIADLVAAGR